MLDSVQEADLQENFYKKYIEQYTSCKFIFVPKIGYIVWRLGTGENIELLHIRTFSQGKGHGGWLIKSMIFDLKNSPPYYSIFGFSLASNVRAIGMYRKAGFKIIECPFPYKYDKSIIFCESFVNLYKGEKMLEDSPFDYKDFLGKITT